MSDYFNEAGEPLMDAAAMRFEQALDAQSAEERYEDSFYGSFLGDEPEWCSQCGEEGHDEYDCDNEDMPDGPEDQWLDGSYEE